MCRLSKSYKIHIKKPSWVYFITKGWIFGSTVSTILAFHNRILREEGLLEVLSVLVESNGQFPNL